MSRRRRWQICVAGKPLEHHTTLKLLPHSAERTNVLNQLCVIFRLKFYLFFLKTQRGGKMNLAGRLWWKKEVGGCSRAHITVSCHVFRYFTWRSSSSGFRRRARENQRNPAAVQSFLICQTNRNSLIYYSNLIFDINQNRFV